MYLFGSRARGDYRESSDMDIAIILEDFEGMKRREVREGN
ncbi:MAG: nucleotidyltransferase domain-containing protein [Candidatus Nanohalobium sp.]